MNITFVSLLPGLYHKKITGSGSLEKESPLSIGSEVVRHLEFLKFLVKAGKLP